MKSIRIERMDLIFICAEFTQKLCLELEVAINAFAQTIMPLILLQNNEAI